MNFEELYKKANDNIHADRKIIDSIYDRTFKKVHFSYKRAVLYAASVTLVISLSLIPKFYEGEDIKNLRVIYNPTQQNDIKNTQKHDNNITKEDANNKSVPDITEKKKAEQEKVKQNSDVLFQHGSASITAKTASEESASGGSELKSRIAETSVTEMPYAEYIKYLGWDILSCNLKVPGSMEISVPETITIINDNTTGDVIEDAAYYVFNDAHRPNAFLSVSASLVDKNTENIYNSNEKVFIGDKEVVFIQNDFTREAYAKTGDVWLHIMSIDVADDEFAAFLQSLIN